ncbi:cyclin-dependent kinase 11-like protein, partial [Dinothrombium tinctorium]
MTESDESRVSSDRSFLSSESEDGEIEREPKKKRRRRDRGHGYTAESYSYYRKTTQAKHEVDDDEYALSSDFEERSPSRSRTSGSRKHRHSDSEPQEDDDFEDNGEETLNIKPPQAQHSKSKAISSSSRKYASHRSVKEESNLKSFDNQSESRRKDAGSSKHHRHHYSSRDREMQRANEEDLKREQRRRDESKSLAKYERDREREREREKSRGKSWMVLDEKEKGDRKKSYSQKSHSNFGGREVVYSNLNVASESRRQPNKSPPSDKMKVNVHKHSKPSSHNISSSVVSSSSSKSNVLQAKKITSLIEVQEVEMSEEEIQSEEERTEEKASDFSEKDISESERSGSEAEEIDDEAGEDEKEEEEEEVKNKNEAEGTTNQQNVKDIINEEKEGSENQTKIEHTEETKEELPPYLPAIQGCRSVEEFHCLNRIEEGTYGVVYRARDKRTNEIVALKRLKMEKEKEGFPITSLREINTLLKAQHPNIVTVREIVVGSNIDKIYIVMEYVEHDLKSLMEQMKQPFLINEVKTLMIQLLRAVAHLNNNWILHRDLKTSNLLLNHRGILKVGDFGLAREYGSPLKAYTPVVVTLWYRAPELLLQTKEYSTPIDIWSVGCIFGEFLTMKPLFPGKSEIDQLSLIYKDLGTPNEKIWPGYSELPLVKKVALPQHPYNNLQKRLGQKLTNVGFDLINRFLTYCPDRRITAEEALKHEFFKESPLPIDPSMFPTWPAKSEQDTNLHIRKAQSPKPPSGGKQYAKQMAGDDDEKLVASSGFHMSLPNQ